MEYNLYKSHRENKKYLILTPGNRMIHFGAEGYSDYTNHKDDDRKQRYIDRHSKILKKDGSRAIDDINSPSFWSLNLLWNKKTLKQSIRDTQKNFSIKINDNSKIRLKK